MTDSAQPFAAKKFLEIKGRRMAYIDEGEGAPIVFAHGNPTSSYLWRNVMPACRGLGRLIACDMIGMGDSEKLPDSGPDRYTYAEQRSFLFALWKKLGVDKDVVFVLHDWGSLLGFDWTRQHAERVQGIAYMEALVQPITWEDWPENERSIFQRKGNRRFQPQTRAPGSQGKAQHPRRRKTIGGIRRQEGCLDVRDD